MEMNNRMRARRSVKFLERVGHVKTVKPRCVLIFGRSENWDDEQREAFRILNSNYHNLTIMTYDHVLERAERMIGTKTANTRLQPTAATDRPSRRG